jgi:hypothetical protein
LSIVFAMVAADGGLLASFQSNVKASVFITSVSFAIYVAARVTGPLLRDRRRSHHQGYPADPEAVPPRPGAELAGTSVAAASAEDGRGSRDCRAAELRLTPDGTEPDPARKGRDSSVSVKTGNAWLA